MTTTRALSETDAETPVQERRFEEYVPGSVFVYGSFTMTEQDVLRFAGDFDPQSIRTDPEAAGRGPFKGLIAGGRHTARSTHVHCPDVQPSRCHPGFNPPFLYGTSIQLSCTAVQPARSAARRKPVALWRGSVRRPFPAVLFRR